MNIYVSGRELEDHRSFALEGSSINIVMSCGVNLFSYYHSTTQRTRLNNITCHTIHCFDISTHLIIICFLVAKKSKEHRCALVYKHVIYLSISGQG